MVGIDPARRPLNLRKLAIFLSPFALVVAAWAAIVVVVERSV